MAVRLIGDGWPKLQKKLGVGPSTHPEQPPLFLGDKANLYEDVADGSVEGARVGFSPEGGKTERIWQITPDDITDLVESFPIIVGKCEYDASSNGKLTRTLPLADPLYPWLYASALNGIQGYGQYDAIDADPQLEAPTFEKGAFWSHYRLGVESLPRPFPVLPDHYIPSNTGTWYPETDPGTTPEQYVYAEEQRRFCTWDMVPQSDYVTQQKGSMKFNSDDAANSHIFQAMPRYYLPNSLYTVTWYYVPIRLIISAKSYIMRWRGRVNQNAMTGPDGLRFEPGELLYLNFSQKMFTPPVQTVVNLGGYSKIISTEKFAHITFQFLFTRRKLFSSPSVAPTNLNFVVGGHNLLPWMDGNFRYAEVSTDSTRRPTWLSAPLETLFTDCDTDGGVA